MEMKDVGSYWPHKFTRDGKAEQIGVEKLDSSQTGDTTVPIMVQPMICVHCAIRFVQGKEAPPPGPCPARNTKTEWKRLHS